MSRVVKKRVVSPMLESLEERSLLSAAGYQPPVAYNNPGPLYPVAGDFDGNGAQDVAVYDANTDTFELVYVNSQGVPTTGLVIPYGYHTGGVDSIPVTGDFNADGVTDIGIYLPTIDKFALDLINAQGQSIGQYVFNYGYHTGGVNSIPLVGDFNADGRSDVGVYLPTQDQFSLNFLGAQGQSIGQFVFNYGYHTGGVESVPLVGDFNADGRSDVGVYLPTVDKFALNLIGAQGQSTGQFIFNYGYHTSGFSSVPLVGDFNGDGRSDVGVYLPALGQYSLNYLGAQGQSIGQEIYADATNYDFLVPFIADFNGDGTADLGFYEPGSDFTLQGRIRRTGG